MGNAARPLGRATSIAVGIALILGLAAPPVLAVEPAATTIDMAWVATPETNVPFSATITLTQVDPPGTATTATGDVTVAEGATTLTTCTLANGTCDVTLTFATAGDHPLTVSYPGDANFAASSNPETVTVVENIVDATGVGLSYGTFYPVKDGYRDSVTARGTRNEAATVKVKVFNLAGKPLKASPLLPSAKGAYAWSWNGRNAAGTMYPAGKYRITQTLTDAFGKAKTWTNWVNLSPKRLYTYTKTFTKDAAHFTFSGTGWGGWQFALPTATVYKKIVFGVDAKSKTPVGGFGPQDFTICTAAYVGPACAAPIGALPTVRAWKSVAGNVTRNRAGTRVRLFIWKNGGAVWVWAGRVTVTYGILK